MVEFPSEFDSNIYRSKNKDLLNMTDEELILHYNNHGKREGRICSRVENRSFASELLPQFSSCLEIGPFDCPVIKGPNVEYFDVLDQQGLYDRAVTIGRTGNLTNIPFIKHISETGDLTIINKKYDLVLSCHSIEHQIDFIQHLKNVEKILLSGGYYAVLLPDKRYCFDHFIRETTIADVLQYHLNKTPFHTVKSVIEHRALTCHNDAVRHWVNDHGEKVVNSTNVLAAINEYNNGMATNSYVDVHSLQFTPDSFREIINLLNEMGYIKLKVDKIYPTLLNSCEFYVILKL
jgi:hypothetical protein